MFTYRKENSLPIKSWIPEEDYYADEKMVEQVENLSKLPFAFHHIALSPDGHVGYGMPIGGVMATKGVIVPNAVGVDIGCGMCAVKTSLTEINRETLKKILGEIRNTIPLGLNRHKEDQDVELMPPSPSGYDGDFSDCPIVEREWDNALKSLGTLGGGNHFIEIQKGDDGHIWIMIHSGSRNLGKQVADHYNKMAREINKKYFSSIDDKIELAFLPLDSNEGEYYMREMNYCVEFALANRKHMMSRIKRIFHNYLDVDFDEIINIAHNYARMENHFNENVMIHRKGATLASVDTIGIIPGSQGTKSYIVKGKGNPDSFNSCSHGAGRKMGRKDAEKKLDLKAEIYGLDSQGILHAIRGVKDLDEAPGAYKNIDEVMANQSDLIDILVELSPLAVVKG